MSLLLYESVIEQIKLYFVSKENLIFMILRLLKQ